MEGYREARESLIKFLDRAIRLEVVVLHEERADWQTKNLLRTQQVTLAELRGAVVASTGNHHRASPHHQAPTVTVHELRQVTYQKRSWYLKWYRVDENVLFISVHF